MKINIKNCIVTSLNKKWVSKCDQICSFLQIWSHLLKKSLMENFIFCAVHASRAYAEPCLTLRMELFAKIVDDFQQWVINKEINNNKQIFKQIEDGSVYLFHCYSLGSLREYSHYSACQTFHQMDNRVFHEDCNLRRHSTSFYHFHVLLNHFDLNLYKDLQTKM